MNKFLALAIIINAALILASCAMQPWVKPYEKAHLADEIMLLDRDPIASSYLEHVYDAREGARGAGTAAGGGCGCN